ncbi:hypothetical protein BDY24DRAFT_261653 [Mrakia frigida]|uniref:uncharacterized protein n=1 Tax=Mrakia frigida TaxID=29902 RepID=UPI003FCBF280
MREAGAGDGDMVLDAALAIFLAILAKDARSIEQILRRKGEDCFVVVGKMLRSREDGFSLARSVEGGRPMKSKDRLAVNLMNELVRIHGLSGIGLEGSQISLRAVASSIFASIVTASGSRVDRFAVLEGAGVSKRIAASLEAEIETLPSRIKGHEKGLPLLPKEDPPDFEHVEHCLTILENLVVRFPEAQKMVESTRPDLPSLLGTLLVACHCLVGDEEEDEESSLALIGMNCLVTALRVLVNVTNTSPFWCEGVLQSQPVITTILRLIHTSNLPTPDSPRLLAPLLSSPSKVFPSSSPLPPIPGVSDLSGEVDESAALTAATEALKVDVLCLSLGLLNNLVEGVEAARDRVRRTGEFVVNPSASRRELDLTSLVPSSQQSSRRRATDRGRAFCSVAAQIVVQDCSSSSISTPSRSKELLLR